MSDINTDLETMQDMLYDPTLVQDEVLTLLDKAANGDINIPDPNNPFIYLMETNILPMTAALNEVTQSIRNIHPILANSREELYPHLVDSDLEDTYATPSKAMFTFYINKNQILTNGYKNTNSTEITIPKGSSIIINDINFTMLNNVNITVFENNTVFVKIIGNNDVSAINYDVLIPAGIVRDNNQIEWLLFEIEVQQLKLISLTDSVIRSNMYSKEVLIDNQFSHIEIGNLINGTINNLNISYSNFVYSKDTVTAYIKKLEDRIKIEIPYFYIVNNLLGDELKINIYTTKGNITEPISNYTAEDTFIKFNIGTSQDPRITSINNISIFCKSNTYTYGGRDEIDFDTLKNKIINNTTGENILPITEYDIQEELSKEGFKLQHTNDSVFRREFIVHKYLNNDYDNINAYMDIFMDTVQFDNTNIDDYYVINGNNYIIINPFTVFNYDNVKLNIVSKDVIDNISTLTKDNLNNYVNDQRLFYNIYKYILDYDTDTACRIYDINTPNIDNIKDNIINTNTNMDITITAREISRIKDKYYIKYTIIGDEAFTNLNINDLKGQIALRHEDTNTYVYITGDIIEDNGVYSCTIILDSTGYIDGNDRLTLQNFIGDISNVNIDLNILSNFILYTKDTSLTTNKTYIINEIYDTDSACDLYKESMEIHIGKPITHLYNKYNIDYTDRKYLTYQEDIYLTYTSNVYQMDENGIVVEYIDTTEDGIADTAVPVLLHSKDDFVLDDNDEKIILHNAGDVILNEDGNPTIDTVYGMIHSVDIMLLEYEYKLVTNDTYKQYIIDNYNYLTDLCTFVLNDINNKLLDNTIIKYKPLTILENVNLLVNKIVYNNPNFITPTITVYMRDVITDSKLYTLLKNTLSLVLQNGLRDELPMSDIVNNMLEYKDLNLLAIDISGVDIINDINMKVYSNNSSRFVIDKKLILDDEGKITVELNTTLNILTI